MKIDIENLDNSNAIPIHRINVPGGWLVIVSKSSITFLADPEHKWKKEQR